jgi:hypothetical protein
MQEMVSSARLKEELIGGATLSVEGERGQRYPFGVCSCWVSGHMWGWAGTTPQSLFALFCSFDFLFLFSISFKTFS